MALDRLIRLVVQLHGDASPRLDKKVWAEQLDEGSIYEPDDSGFFLRTFRNRTYHIRYDADLMEPQADGDVYTPLSLTVYDEEGRNWTGVSFGEVGERRRFGEIQVRREQVDIVPPEDTPDEPADMDEPPIPDNVPDTMFEMGARWASRDIIYAGTIQGMAVDDTHFWVTRNNSVLDKVNKESGAIEASYSVVEETRNGPQPAVDDTHIWIPVQTFDEGYHVFVYDKSDGSRVESMEFEHVAAVPFATGVDDTHLWILGIGVPPVEAPYLWVYEKATGVRVMSKEMAMQKPTVFYRATMTVDADFIIYVVDEGGYRIYVTKHSDNSQVFFSQLADMTSPSATPDGFPTLNIASDRRWLYGNSVQAWAQVRS